MCVTCAKEEMAKRIIGANLEDNRYLQAPIILKAGTYYPQGWHLLSSRLAPIILKAISLSGCLGHATQIWLLKVNLFES